MNEILNMFLLARDQFMAEMHLKLKLRPLTKTKNKEIIQKFKEAGDSKYIYQNELKKTYFQHEMADGDFKNLPRRTPYDKVLRNKTFQRFKIWWESKRPCFNCLQIFWGKAFWWCCYMCHEIILNQQSAEELHKPIIKKFEKRKVYSSFKDNIWGVDLDQLRSKYNKGFRFLLCVI